MQNTVPPHGGGSGTQESPRQEKVYEKPRPLNWHLTDPMYNLSICEELGLEIDDKLDGGLSSDDQVAAYHTYTDGSFLRGEGAGWVFSIFNRGDAMGEGKPFLTAAGPIVTLRKSIFSLGRNGLLPGWRKLMQLLKVYFGGRALGRQRRPTTNNINTLSKLWKLLFLPWTPSMWLNFCRANAGPSKINCWLALWYIYGNLLALFFPPSPLEPRPRQPCKELHTTPRHRCCGQIGTYCWGWCK